MTGLADLLLVAVLVLDVYVGATGRLGASVRALALQGVVLAGVPLALAGTAQGPAFGHALAMALATLALKGFVIPGFLMRAIRVARVKREAEPFVSLHVSVLAGAALVGLAFLLARTLVLPRGAPAALLVPIALSTVLLGGLMLVVRKKAVTQVVAFVVMENGVFLFGQCVAATMPFVVEAGMALEVFVGVFVMGIVVHQIAAEFDHIDTDALSELGD